jgi:hypothetical protein
MQTEKNYLEFIAQKSSVNTKCYLRKKLVGKKRNSKYLKDSTHLTQLI